jgi:hypothetical protein
MIKKNFWLLLILAVFLISCGWLIGNRGEVEDKKPLEPRSLGQVELVFDFGEGELSTYSASLDHQSTVFEVLNRVAEVNGLSLVKEDSDFGVFVKEIAGRANTKDSFWLYYVNGQMAEVAADKYELREGDLVEWKYEKQF